MRRRRLCCCGGDPRLLSVIDDNIDERDVLILALSALMILTRQPGAAEKLYAPTLVPLFVNIITLHAGDDDVAIPTEVILRTVLPRLPIRGRGELAGRLRGLVGDLEAAGGGGVAASTACSTAAPSAAVDDGDAAADPTAHAASITNVSSSSGGVPAVGTTGPDDDLYIAAAFIGDGLD